MQRTSAQERLEMIRFRLWIDWQEIPHHSDRQRTSSQPSRPFRKCSNCVRNISAKSSLDRRLNVVPGILKMVVKTSKCEENANLCSVRFRLWSNRNGFLASADFGFLTFEVVSKWGRLKSGHKKTEEEINKIALIYYSFDCILQLNAVFLYICSFRAMLINWVTNKSEVSELRSKFNCQEILDLNFGIKIQLLFCRFMIQWICESVFLSDSFFLASIRVFSSSRS